MGDDCLLLVCLAEDVQPEDVEQMTEYAPAKIIISRDSFADDTAMANAYYILRDHGIELKLSLIHIFFASSEIEIYPFQIAAASFALRSPYQKGAVLCDEAGMGKSHEAMLVINQKWLEGRCV